MDNNFILSTDTPIYLYGAASVGKIIYGNNPALNICGFLDIRAEEIKEFMGLPVYTLLQAESALDKTAVIVLSVKNVFEHEDIAANLYEAGFNRLIYKSRAVLEGCGSIDNIRLSEIWDLLVEGNFGGTREELSCFQDNVCYNFTDRSVIRSGNGMVLTCLPVEMIYTNARNDKWSDLNIQGYYPHIYFFYYLSNHRNGGIQDYLKFAEETARMQGDIKITEAWRKNVVRNRTNVYEHMRASLDTDPHFFHRNAPTAVWNKKGYFNLTSGKHRCAFLVSQGYRYIAVSVNTEDYQKFLAYGNPEDTREKIKRENRRWLSTKIYHPWFYRYPCTEPEQYSQFQVEALCRAIRLSMEYGRAVRLFTNILEENSLTRILGRCRIIQRVKNAAEADILLLDERGAGDYEGSRQNSKQAYIWRIGSVAADVIVAEYYSKQGPVYFCESIEMEEDG